MKKHPIISVVILAYRAQSGIVDFVQQVISSFESAGIFDFELVVVGNYDPNTNDDSTPKIVRSLANTDKRITPVTIQKQGMMGWDARQGFDFTTGDIVALIDGDGQMPPVDIIRLFQVIRSGEFDLVKTYRMDREDGILRKFSSIGFNTIFRILFPGCYFRDINSKPKLMTRSALEKMDLHCNGWFLDGEIILEAMRLNLIFAEIPTTFKKNEWRGSFVNMTTVFEMLISMLRYRLGFKDSNNL